MREAGLKLRAYFYRTKGGGVRIDRGGKVTNEIDYENREAFFVVALLSSELGGLQWNL